MKLKFSASLAVMAMCALTSCHHKGLCFDEPTNPSKLINVVFDWTDAPDACPESMALYLYPSGGKEPIRFSLNGRDGGTIRIPADSYDALALNNDNTDWARLRDVDAKSQFSLYTQSLTPTAPGGEFADAVRSYTELAGWEAAVCNPQMFWDGHTDNFVVTSTPEPQTLVVRMAEDVCHYTVEVRDVEGLDNLDGQSVTAVLSSMSDGAIIYLRQGSTFPASIAFYLKGAEQQRLLSDEFLTFGESPETNSPHALTILVKQADNTLKPYSFDVTDQIHQASDPRHVHIIVTGLKIPAKPVAGGFTVNVEAWDDEYIPMKM